MPKYYYTGKTLDGLDSSGFINAASPGELESKLLSKGIFIEDFQPVTERWLELYLKYFKSSELTKSTRQLHLLLQSGISLLDALDLTWEQLKDKRLKNIWGQIKNGVEQGKPISMLLSGFPFLFDKLYVGMVLAGEISGDLASAYDRIASYRENMESLTRKIRSALAYPVLVILVAVLVVFALVLYVVPIFSSMYANFGSELPQLTQTIVSFSEILKSNFWVLFLILIIFVLGVFYSLLNQKVKLLIHTFYLKVPFINNFLIKFITARFSRTMGALLVSGVEIIKAFEIASLTSGNLFISKSLNECSNYLVQGKSFSDTIASINLFPNPLLKLSTSGEKTGQLGEMLLRASEYYEKETESSIQIITTLLEPLIIIVLGVVVAFILIAMYLPLFDLVGTI